MKLDFSHLFFALGKYDGSLRVDFSVSFKQNGVEVNGVSRVTNFKASLCDDIETGIFHQDGRKLNERIGPKSLLSAIF